MTVPKVSVCVPTYNRATTLRHTIEAVEDQSFSDWELIVCDDGSTDGTEDVVRCHRDRRIRYYRNQANLGLYPNWNRCIALATGEHVAIYHDHDLYLPTILQRSVALLDQHPRASFVHTALVLIGEANTPVDVDVRELPELMPGQAMMRHLATQWASPVMAATAMVRRSAYQLVGPYQHERYGLGCDMDMWFRLSAVGDVAYVRDPQCFVRVRSRRDATASFRWSDQVGALRMHRDHLERAFGDRAPAEYWARRVQYALRRDRHLATFMIRALLLEPSHVISEGDAAVRAEASLWVALLAAMCGKPVVEGVLRRVVLPLHRTRVRRAQRGRYRRAIEYLASEQGVAERLESWALHSGAS